MPVARHGLDGLICDVGHSESEARRVLGCGCAGSRGNGRRGLASIQAASVKRDRQIGGQIFIHVLITASRGPRRSLAQLEWVAGEPRLVDNGATAAPRAPSVSLCMDRNRRLAHWITAYLWKRGPAVVGSVNATTALLRAAKRKFTGINRGDRPLMPSPYGTNN
ncbi:hypothetical protein PoMZ_05948, partial [Pyricularia oryzae]